MTNIPLGLRVFSKPHLFTLFTGQFISQSGNQIYTMASLWMAYQLTHSTVAMSGVEAVSLIPVLVVGSFGGLLMDRADPLRSMIYVDIVCTITLGLIPFIYFVGHLTVWALATTSIVLTGASMLFSPALQGIVPQMTTKDELAAANGILDLINRLSKMFGPAAAGAMMVLIPLIHLFTFDALTFAISAISLICVRFQSYKRLPAFTAARPRPLGTVRRGSWKVLLKTPWLRTVTLVRSVNNGFWALYTIGSPIFIQSHFKSGISPWGLILAAYGAGQVLGTMVAAQFTSCKNSLRPFFYGWLLIGLSFAAYAASPTIAIAASCIFLAGVGGPIAHVATNTRIGRDISPDQLIGVFRLQKMMVNILSGIGVMAAGIVYHRVDPQVGILVAGLGITAVMLATVILVYIDTQRGTGISRSTSA